MNGTVSRRCALWTEVTPGYRSRNRSWEVPFYVGWSGKAAAQPSISERGMMVSVAVNAGRLESRLGGSGPGAPERVTPVFQDSALSRVKGAQ